MNNDLSYFQEENHDGFSDIMLSSKEEYPKECFNPKQYFTQSGSFIYHHKIILPELPKIKRIEEINKQLEKRKETKIINAAINNLGRKRMIELEQCPICKRLIDPKDFKYHINKCSEKEKQEKKNEEKNRTKQDKHNQS